MICEFILKIVDKNDVGRSCPFTPDGEFELYADALKEDISGIPGVLIANRVGGALKIEINDDVDFSYLKNSVNEIISGQYYDKLRVSLNGFD